LRSQAKGRGESEGSDFYLLLELPTFPFPVIFEERLYDAGRAHLPFSHVSQFASPIWSTPNGNTDIMVFDLSGKNALSSTGACFEVLADWDAEKDRPSEGLFRRLTRHSSRRDLGKHLKPSLLEKESLERIVHQPLTLTLSSVDKEMLYKFRYTLHTIHFKALTKFLLCVDWTSTDDVEDTTTVLEQWKKEVKLPISEALKLLDKDRAFQNSLVRAAFFMSLLYYFSVLSGLCILYIPSPSIRAQTHTRTHAHIPETI
jgi:phosphatidylinositol 3-kinase